MDGGEGFYREAPYNQAREVAGIPVGAGRRVVVAGRSGRKAEA